MGRRLGVEPASKLPWQQALPALVRDRHCLCSRGSSCREDRAQANPCAGGERAIGKIGPNSAVVHAQKHHPIAPLAEGGGPRKTIDAERDDRFCEQCSGLLSCRNRQRLLAEDERAKPSRPPRLERRRR